MIFLFAALGAILASFAGVVAGRLHTGQSFARGRSRCDACAAPLAHADLVPVFSWLAMRGRCRSCATRVSALGPLTEIILAVLFAAAYARLGLVPALIPLFAAFVVLLALVLYDLAHTIVPWSLSISLGVLALVYAALVAPSTHALMTSIFVAAGIGAAFALLHFFSGGRAMGLGDAPVAFSLSVLVAPYAFTGLTLSFWIGAVVGIAILLGRPSGRRMGIEVPFVPFMAAGYLLTFLTHFDLYPYLWH